MIEWRTGEDNWDGSTDEWETPLINALDRTRAEAIPQPDSSGFPVPGQFIARHRRVAVLLGLVIALVTAAGLALKWQSDRNLAAVQAGVQGVVDQEMWALESGNRELYASLLDQQAPPRWRQAQQDRFEVYLKPNTSIYVPSRSFSAVVTELTLVEPDIALAEVQIDPPDRQPYRETRAYRQAGSTWRRTPAPPGQLWLHPVERETANLRFVFHHDDAERLAPLLPAMQDLYAQLLADFGLTPIPTKRELRIALSVRPADAGFADSSVGYDLTPLVTTFDPEQIRRELGRQLTDTVTAQFYDDAGDMAFVLDGIREWEVSSWTGGAGAAFKVGAVFRILKDKPFIPLLMVGPAHFDPATVEVLTATIVDYLAQRHGRGVVKRLLQGVDRYGRWPALIEDGLDLPYRDVAAGWWHFVAQHYGPPGDRAPNRMRADVAWLLQLEKQALETRDQELFRSLLDPQAPAEWKNSQLSWFRRGLDRRPVPDPADIQDWGYTGTNLVWVAVGVTSESPEAWLMPRRLRFLRFANQRWYLTSPDTVFSSPPLTVRTRYLAFRYREPDADLMGSVRANVDALYEQVARDLGIDAGRRNLTITFFYSDSDSIAFGSDRPNDISIPSPRLFGDLETFRFFLGFVVADTLLTEDVEMQQSQQIAALLYGLTLWEAEQWGDFPVWQAQKKAEVQRALEAGASPSLAPDASPLSTTLIEYIATTYSRHRLADLTQAAKEHHNLPELIPAALDVDLESFEAGWQTYLERTYGR